MVPYFFFCILFFHSIIIVSCIFSILLWLGSRRLTRCLFPSLRPQKGQWICDCVFSFPSFIKKFVNLLWYKIFFLFYFCLPFVAVSYFLLWFFLFFFKFICSFFVFFLDIYIFSVFLYISWHFPFILCHFCVFPFYRIFM